MKIENLEKNTYDEMVYKSNPFSYSSPLTLEACGTLFGLEPASSTKNSRIRMFFWRKHYYSSIVLS